MENFGFRVKGLRFCLNGLECSFQGLFGVRGETLESLRAFRSNLEQIRQSRPDSGLGLSQFQVQKSVNPPKVFPLRSPAAPAKVGFIT